MRILVVFFTPYYADSLDGAQRRFVEVVRHWEGLHDLVVLEPRPGLVRRFDLPFRSEEIEMRELGKRQVRSNALAHWEWTRKALRNGIELCRRERFDLILVPLHNYSLLKPAMALRRRFGIPVITVVHAPERAELEGSLLGMYRIARGKTKGRLASLLWVLSHVLGRAATRRSDAILTVSHASARGVEQMGVPRERILVSSNGVNIAHIDGMTGRAERGFDGVFLARPIPEKGIFDLMHVWAAVCRELPQASLAVFGSARQDYREQMLEIADAQGVAGNVTFCGFTPDPVLFPILKRSRVYVFPSWGEAEGWPLSVGEAMACGLPVVAYDIPAVREAYGAARSVHLVPSRDVQAMAGRIVTLLQDERQRTRLSADARAFAERLDWSEVSRRDERLIRDFLGWPDGAGRKARLQPSAT